MKIKLLRRVLAQAAVPFFRFNGTWLLRGSCSQSLELLNFTLASLVRIAQFLLPSLPNE